jgi:hypothetical protein
MYNASQLIGYVSAPLIILLIVLLIIKASKDKKAKATPIQAVAGWYPDSDAPGQMRYWDGAAWTDQRKLAGGA